MGKTKIELLEEKMVQLNRQKQAILNKINAKERKLETRKKILAGSWILSEAAKNEDANKKMLAGLNKFLSRESDRKLFGLSAIIEDNQEKEKYEKMTKAQLIQELKKIEDVKKG